MRAVIVFPEGLYNIVRSHILKDSPKEGFAFLLAGHNETRGCLKLLVREAILPEPKDLQYQHGGGVCPKKEFQIRVYKRCHEEKLDLIDVHSHPFASERVNFSAVDDASELGTEAKEGTFPYLARKIKDIHHASVVFGQRSLAARIYNPEMLYNAAVENIAAGSINFA